MYYYQPTLQLAAYVIAVISSLCVVVDAVEEGGNTAGALSLIYVLSARLY